MEFAANKSLNSSNQYPTQAYVALGTIHLIIVVIPSFVIASASLYFILRITRKTGVQPVTLLYALVAILSIVGPLSYGILNDISAITNLPIFGNCFNPHPVYVIHTILYFGVHMIIMVTIAMISLVQLLMLHAYKITSKMVLAAFVPVVILAIAVGCINFNGSQRREIRGSFCKQDGITGAVPVIVWSIVAFVIPVIVATICSVLTCIKVKNSSVQGEVSLSDWRVSAVKSVVAVNSFNMVINVVVRFAAFFVYFLSVSLTLSQDNSDLLQVVALYVGDLNYSLSCLSSLILHSGIRRMAFGCFSKCTDTCMSTWEDI